MYVGLFSYEIHKANTFNNYDIRISNINIILHITKLIILINNKNFYIVRFYVSRILRNPETASSFMYIE